MGNTSGANARSVWTMATQGYKGAHFATFPEELPRGASLPEPRPRGYALTAARRGLGWLRKPRGMENDMASLIGMRLETGCLALMNGDTQTLGWQPTCGCNADTVPEPSLTHSGTTLAVAQVGQVGDWH